MTWRQALAEFEDGEDEGWLDLRHDATGDLMGFAPIDRPTDDELAQLYAQGWRNVRPN